MPDVAHHPRALRRVAQEAAFIQLGDQVGQEILQLRLGGDAGFVGHQLARHGRLVGAPPLIGHDHDRLREIERHEGGVERIAHQRVRMRHVVVVQPGTLRAEQQPHAQVAGSDGAQLRRGAARGHHRLDDVARPRAGGEDMVQVGDRVGDALVHRQRIQDAVRAGGVAPGLLLRPAVARGDQAQMEQAAIGHGAGDRADIVGKLRAHQHHHRAVANWVQVRPAITSGHVVFRFCFRHFG